MILYHFTSRSHHWPLIATTRYLDLSESNINPKAPHSGPDVVWLTVRKDPFGNGLGDGSDIRIGKQTFKGTDKTRVRITVDIHDAQQWPRWSKNHGIKSSWYNTTVPTLVEQIRLVVVWVYLDFASCARESL